MLDKNNLRRRKSENIPVKPIKKVWECKYRSKDIIDKVKSNCCGGRGKFVDVYQCEIHEKCTVQPVASGSEIKCCKLCEDLDNGVDFEKE
jgi:hypothetical protein